MSRRAGLSALVLFALLAPGGRAADPAPAAHEPVTVESLVQRLDDADANVRRVASARLRNLPGTDFAAVEAASKRDDLSPEAAEAIKVALPALRRRAWLLKLDAEIDAYDDKSQLESYEKAGKKDPRWDDLVRGAFRAADGTKPLSRAQVVDAFKKAADAGCDDPLAMYLYARYEWLLGPADRDAVLARHRAAAVAMAESKHAAEWTCRAAARYIEQTGAPDEQISEIVRNTFPRAIAETGRPNDDVSGFVDLVHDALTTEMSAQDAFELIYPHYAKARPANDPGPHLYKGDRYVQAAWEARGGGWAHTVTPEGWKLFGERLAVAREALEKAWAADPTDGRAPTHMIKVILGDGGGKGQMEMWFRRAMANNPDNRTACGSKLWYLYPRWHGSHAEMLVFGRQCAATQNWWGPLPTILVDAHEGIAKEMADPKEYLAQPQVWDDIESVYRSFLEIFPDSPKAGWYRSKMAMWACECQQWTAAKRIFDEIGDKPDLQVFRSQAVYNYYKKKAAKLAVGATQV
jgi:hypothetical protein